MIAETLRFIFRDFAAVMLVLALMIAAVSRARGAAAPGRLLSWLLLLPIGLSGLWAAAFHVFLSGAASTDIGWQPSPFEFEVGMADLAIGITACIGSGKTFRSKRPPCWPHRSFCSAMPLATFTRC